MRKILIKVFFFLAVSLPVAHAAQWGDIATISKTTADYLCTHNGADVYCVPESPHVDNSGNVSATGYVTATGYYGNGSNLKNVTANNTKLVDGLDSLQFLRSDVDDTYTGTLTLSGQLDATSLSVDTDTLFVDDTTNRVGVGTSTPQATLEVMGTISATSFLRAVPSGMIAMIADTACPSGWSEFSAAQGVFIRGYGDSSNTYDPDGSTRTVGVTVQAENYASHNHSGSSGSVADHTHAVNPASYNETAASDGAHTHTTNPSTTDSGGQSQGHTHNVDFDAKTVNTNSNGNHNHTISANQATNNQTGGSNNNVLRLKDGITGNTTRTTAADGGHTHDFTVDFGAITSGDASVGHTHTFDIPSTTSTSNGDHTHTVAVDIPNTATDTADSHGHTITVDSNGGGETRPDNIALLFCRKD